MPRLLSDSESDQDVMESLTLTRKSSRLSVTSSPNVVSPKQSLISNSRISISSTQMPMMPIIMCHNSGDNTMVPIEPDLKNISTDDPNKCFFLVMPITAKDLKENIGEFNKNDFKKHSKRRSTNSEIFFPPEWLFKLMKNYCTEKPSDLVIIDKVPQVKLTRLDPEFIKSVSSPINWIGNCCICKKSYSNMKNLQTHINKNHIKAKVFFCEICGETFLKREQMYKHITKKHNPSKFQTPVKESPKTKHFSSTRSDTSEMSVMSTSSSTSNLSTPKSQGRPTTLFSVCVKKPEEVISKKSTKPQTSKFRRKSRRILNKSNSGDKSDSNSPESKLIVSVNKVIKIDKTPKSLSIKANKEEKIENDNLQIESTNENLDINVMDDFEEVLSNENESPIENISFVDGNIEVEEDKAKSANEQIKHEKKETSIKSEEIKIDDEGKMTEKAQIKKKEQTDETKITEEKKIIEDMIIKEEKSIEEKKDIEYKQLTTKATQIEENKIIGKTTSTEEKEVTEDATPIEDTIPTEETTNVIEEVTQSKEATHTEDTTITEDTRITQDVTATEDTKQSNNITLSEEANLKKDINLNDESKLPEEAVKRSTNCAVKRKFKELIIPIQRIDLIEKKLQVKKLKLSEEVESIDIDNELGTVKHEEKIRSPVDVDSSNGSLQLMSQPRRSTRPRKPNRKLEDDDDTYNVRKVNQIKTNSSKKVEKKLDIQLVEKTEQKIVIQPEIKNEHKIVFQSKKKDENKITVQPEKKVINATVKKTTMQEEDQCYSCKLTQSTIQSIIASKPNKNETIKCPLCPDLLLCTKESLYKHLSSKHWSCSKKVNCINNYDDDDDIIQIPKMPPFISCAICHRKFVSKEFLQKHMNLMHNCEKIRKVYRCIYCNANFNGNDSYYNHFMAHHSSIDNAPQEIQNDDFIKISETQRSSKTYKIPCTVCKIKYKSKSDLCKHHHMAHPEYSTMCSICYQAFKVKNDTLDHVLNHVEIERNIIVFNSYEESVETEVIDITTELLSNGTMQEQLDKTLSIANSSEEVITLDDESCDIQIADTVILKRKHDDCTNYDVISPKLTKIANNVTTFCKICNKSFETEKLYNEHAYFYHDAVFDDSMVNEILTPKNDVLFSGDNLDEIAAVTSVVKELLDAVVMNREKTMDVSIKDVPEKIVGIGSIVEELSDLDANEDSDRTINDELMCILCAMNYATKELLNLHKFFNHQDQRYVHICENCCEVLGSVSSVNEHICLRSKVFYCEQCDVRLANAQTLHKHNREKHFEKEELHLCQCGKQFLTNRMLTKHMRISHVEDHSEVSSNHNMAVLLEGSETVTVHIIPIDNQLVRIDKQVADLEKIINLQHYKNVHSRIGVDCSSSRTVITNNYCVRCEIELTNSTGIDQHYMHKHQCQGEICKLCSTMYPLKMETQHMVEHVRSPYKLSSWTDNIHDATCNFIQSLKPACIVSIFLYRLQCEALNIANTTKCIICDETFTDGLKSQRHFLQMHDKMCILCNQTFSTSSLAAIHKARKHKSMDIYLWFVNRSASYFANVIVADEFLNFTQCFCRALALSHEIAVASGNEPQHLGDCKSRNSVSYICHLMSECVENFGQLNSESKQVLLVRDEDIVKYKHDVHELASVMIESTNQLSLEELTKLLTDYVRSLE